MTDTPEKTLTHYAHVAGVLYLVIAICGFFSMMHVSSVVVVPGDAITTAENILANEALFRAGIASDAVIVLCEIALTAYLYVLLKPVGPALSLVAALARLTMTAVQAINVVFNATALKLLRGAGDFDGIDTVQRHSLVELCLGAHETGVLVWGAAFGLHLLVLGYLLFTSKYVPRILGALLVVNALAYFALSFGLILFPDQEPTVRSISRLLAGPGTIGELGLVFWLLVKGVNVPESAESAPERP